MWPYVPHSTGVELQAHPFTSYIYQMVLKVLGLKERFRICILYMMFVEKLKTHSGNGPLKARMQYVSGVTDTHRHETWSPDCPLGLFADILRRPNILLSPVTHVKAN